jgi:vesicle coat complex subunit
MSFYDLPKEKREELVKKIEIDIEKNLENNDNKNIYKYSSDSDTYIRKNAYTALGRIYQNRENLRDEILHLLDGMLTIEDEKIRQTSVYALGEIGKNDTNKMIKIFQKALEDESSSVRNAVIGSLKQMGEKNPEPTLKFAWNYLHHPNPEVRREMVHGIELRGRTHPEEVIPLLEELQNEENKKVRKTIIHVLGQISYKKGCLEKVVAALKNWENQEIVHEALKEIIEVHKRYKFAFKSPQEAENYIKANFLNL